MNFIGTKTLETSRLLLRKVTKDDAFDAYNNWCNSDSVSKYVLWEKHIDVNETYNLFSLWEKEYDDLKTFRWIVISKENNSPIGTIDVSKKYLNFGTCFIGYCYGEKYWNKGYATEALKCVIKFLFEEVGVNTIYAEYLHNNPASGKVMQKVGMKYEGVLRSRIIDKDGLRNDLISYSILKDEYFNKKID